MLEDVQTFHKDEDYERWLYEHPDGFVLNSKTNLDPYYIVLHRASCKSITELKGRAKEGGFTERKYIKICGPDVQSLQAWLKSNEYRNDLFISIKCSKCKPI